MSAVLSLTAQREAVERCLAALDGGPSVDRDTILAARKGVLTLAWFERRDELVRAVVKLDKAAPGLKAIFETFPGADLLLMPSAPKPFEAIDTGEMIDE